MFHHQSMRNDAKHFFRRKKSCILGTPLGEFWRSQNYWSLCPKFRKFSNLVKILQCFLRCSLCSNVSLNIINSYYNEFLCLVSSKNLPPKIKIPDIWDAFWVIGFDLIQILNISLDFKYSRVLSLCSAQSFHHHKWSWISIVSMFGSQDLPRLSTPVWQMWGRRLWWLLKSKFPSLISLRTWEIAIAIDLSSMRVCSAKRNSDEDKICLQSLENARSSWNPETSSRFMGRENQMPRRDENSGVEAEVRKDSMRKKFRWVET